MAPSVPVFDRVLIGGEWVPAERGTYDIVNPATEEVAGRAPECSTAQVAAAARAARRAFEQGPWRSMTGAERGACLRDAAERFRKAIPGLVDLTVAETGALRPIAERLQVAEVVGAFDEAPEEGPAALVVALAARAEDAGRGLQGLDEGQQFVLVAGGAVQQQQRPAVRSLSRMVEV